MDTVLTKKQVSLAFGVASLLWVISIVMAALNPAPVIDAIVTGAMVVCLPPFVLWFGRQFAKYGRKGIE